MNIALLRAILFASMASLGVCTAYTSSDGFLVADFDALPASSDEPYFGEKLGEGFHDSEVHFGNTDSFGYCMGFSCSRISDTTTPGYNNQYAVWSPGHDRSGNGSYAVFYDGGEWGGVNEITFPRQAFVKGFYIDNTTYAALSMLNGDSYAKKFGGKDGTDPDWLKVTISARDANGDSLGSIDAYLADFRSPDPEEDFILSDWTWIDLSAFGPAVKSLSFTVSGSDTSWGYLNTPAYFAMDELEYAYSFSGPTGFDNGNDTDAPIPGYCGGGTDGDAEDDRNAVNPSFAGWASGIASYAPTENVLSTWQVTDRALGPATGNQFDVVSLGELTEDELAAGARPGEITLVFPMPISDKSGPDFAVFENAFVVDDTDQRVFAELGYVEVSSDGVNFTRFPSACLRDDLDDTHGAGYENIDARNIHNLCGKHANGYYESWGTPFDLSELADCEDVRDGRLDLSAVTHVRILDIPGDGSCVDASGRPIRDAWPTLYSGGVDLDAIGVLNSSEASRIDVKVSGNGDVAPLGKPYGYVSVPHGEAVTFTFTPSNDCALAAVMLDGAIQSVDGDKLTIENLQSDHLMNVVFLNPADKTSQGVPYSWLISTGAIDISLGVDAVSAEAAAAADQDADGQSTWAEYFAGTDPLNGDDSLRIISIEVTDAGNAISWLGGTGGSPLPFEVLVSSSLSADAPVETNMVPTRSSTGTNTWIHSAPNGGCNFYQIMVEAEQ